MWGDRAPGDQGEAPRTGDSGSGNCSPGGQGPSRQLPSAAAGLGRRGGWGAGGWECGGSGEAGGWGGLGAGEGWGGWGRLGGTGGWGGWGPGGGEGVGWGGEGWGGLGRVGGWGVGRAGEGWGRAGRSGGGGLAILTAASFRPPTPTVQWAPAQWGLQGVPFPGWGCVALDPSCVSLACPMCLAPSTLPLRLSISEAGAKRASSRASGASCLM